MRPGHYKMNSNRIISRHKYQYKNGVALVMTLGFLAVLTVIAVSFAMQMRMERLSQRSVLSTAQTRYLLDTALSRAMADINSTMADDWYPPPYIASGSSIGGVGLRGYSHSKGVRLSDTMNLTVIPRNDRGKELLGFSDLEFIPTGWPGNESQIYDNYKEAFNNAEWQDVLDQEGKIIGRVGYFIVNTSGLLDANYVGGFTNSGARAGYMPRKNGRTPAEIQLSRDILEELNHSSAIFPGLNESGASYTIGHPLQAVPADLSAGLALAYCRSNAWRRFETVRDFYRCNQLGHYRGFNSAGEPKPVDVNILRNRPKNFFTFSYFPPDNRLYMGQDISSLNENNVRKALAQIGLTPDNADYVLNQLRDYLDTDFIPIHLDFSVEPVPLINEIVIDSQFRITMKLVDDIPVYTLEGNHELAVELWYPFALTVNKNDYSVHFNGEIVFPEGTKNLFGSFSLPGSLDVEDGQNHPWGPSHDRIRIVGESWNSDKVKYNSIDELLADFEALNNAVIEIGEITVEERNRPVDRVRNVEIELGNDDINTFEANLNELNNGDEITNRLEFGIAVVDPRLNWDASDANQWIVIGAGNPDFPATSLEERNIDVSESIGKTPDKKDVLYVRNENRIDSPYEFTYFLYDKEKPWHTFQFFRDNDPDDTRFIVDYLHTFPHGPHRQGLINPNTRNPNVMASVFYRVPMDSYARDYSHYTGDRLNNKEAQTVAQALMNITGNGYITKHSDLGNLDLTDVLDAIQPNASNMGEINPWKAESILRNSAELFNPRDNTFAVFVVAQQVTDANEDNTITEDEVQFTQRAIAYVWREPGPSTHRSCCVFYQRSESLGAFGWSEKKAQVLDAFRPTSSP